jgi:hypothetical protein
MQRRFFIMTVLAAAVAATACTPPNNPVVGSVRESGMGIPSTAGGPGTTDLRLQRDDITLRADLAVPRATLWAAIPAVYKEVGLAEPSLDQSRWTAVLENHNMSRWIGRESMSHFFECGSGPSGPYANSRRIRMTVQTMIETLPGGNSRVHSRVDAVALSVDGHSSQVIECSSLGRIEGRINEGLSRHTR